MNVFDFLIGPTFGKVLDKVFPDPAAKQAAQLQLLSLQQAGEFKQVDADLAMAKGQTDTNLAEAASSSLFKGGWRPFVGWVCGIGLGYDFVLRPPLAWASSGFWHIPVPPALDLSTILPLLGGLLGLGTLRTYERVNGVIPAGK